LLWIMRVFVVRSISGFGVELQRCYPGNDRYIDAWEI
jgi:hypothetical protein